MNRRSRQTYFGLIAIGGVWLAHTSPAQAALPTDVAAHFKTTSIASLTINGVSTPLHLLSGSTTLQDGMPTCVVSPPLVPSCTAVLNVFHAAFQTFSVSTTSGTFTVTNPTVAATGPVTLVDTGAGFVLPTGSSVTVAGILTGTFSDGSAVPQTQVLQTTALTAAAVMNLSIPNQTMTVSGTFPFNATAFGRTIVGTISTMLSAQSPFDNVPPVANAGADQTVPCGQTVALSGSLSTDVNNNITSYKWLRAGTVIATAKSPNVTLPLGPSNITLIVTDSFGGTSTDTVEGP